MPVRLHVLDGGVLTFDRETGDNVLFVTDATRALVRGAPRTLQIGLLSACNLRCSFCYRDAAAPSRLTAGDVLEICRDAAEWGVLEVAFGGGEPLLFPGFVELCGDIRRTTPLGVNVTTNGTLLDRATAERLRSVVSEIRLSIYEDNGWRERLTSLSGHAVGANWLVTPANVGLVVPRVAELVQRGARNVLLLGYKGDDASMQLDRAGIAALRRAVEVLRDFPLRVDVCWYPELRDLPYLFERTDCGAGDDSIVITPDRRVLACSFAHEGVPFEDPRELRTIWARLRQARPHAQTGGCTRERFGTARAAHVVSGRVVREPGAYAWRAWASSNSGPYLLIAQFPSAETAQRVADEVRAMYEAHLAYVTTEGYSNQFLERYGEPTPPMQEFARAHGFEWPARDGFAWEEMEEGGLEIEAIDRSLVVHIRYGQQIGEAGLRLYANQQGADAVVGPDQPFTIRVTGPVSKLQAVLEDARADLEGLRDLDESASSDWTFEIDGIGRIGFTATIGGCNDAASFLLMLGSIEHVQLTLASRA